VIDPLYTLPFLVFLILAMQQKKGSEKRRKYNNLGLAISTGYLLLALVLKGLAYTQFVDALDKQEISYKRIEVRPAPLNTILWTANVEVKSAYLIGDYSFFDEDGIIQFKAYPKNHDYLGKLKDNPKIQRLIDISNGWYTITQKNGSLFFNDLRFGKLNPYQSNSYFVFSYKLIPTEGGLKVKETEKDPEAAKALLSDLWERIKGN
ncbi:MAG TPA: metal-dependent hydrolase, partial [Salinimicrobium sp.]|nr:metal-dependent hydrolase [Salinimicrobium sp.]